MTPLINPGASDEDSELFSRCTNEAGGLYRKLLSVIRQGEPGNALYIIIAGQAKVTLTNKLGMELEVMTILRGEFFGEMALFSGEPSPVSIVAVDDLQVLVIYSDAVNTMIERQPSLGREIGQIIEARSKAVSMAGQAD